MAGNKINTKTKVKDERSKGNSKPILLNNDEIEETDFSMLRKPIQTSITGFAQARKIFDMATEELKSLLSEECDLLYECKVCRNLFRSLANFISHKRVYCKDKFNSTVHGHFIKSSSTLNELTKIKRTEDGYQESLKEAPDLEVMETDEVDERIPLTKDLTTIIEKIANKKGLRDKSSENTQVTLENIPSSTVAVFQNLDTGEDNKSENMKNQVMEIDNILSRNVAVLQNDGNFKIQKFSAGAVTEPQEGVIQISDDEENGHIDDLKCKKCDMQFSTQKTLRFHMKYKHVDTRVVYPCPDCLEIFSTSWSVYRHLFKVHRKTAAQIRRLRESIQAKAFKMNNPPPFYEKRKNNMKTPTVPKITEEERLDQENQAWMDNMETDACAPRCGGCGRTFERRAALQAHTYTCQPRSRALAPARRAPDAKRIEIQIRKDYNKGPQHFVLPAATHDANENKITKEIKEPKEIVEEEKPKVKPKKESEPEEVPEQSKAAAETTATVLILDGKESSHSCKTASKPSSPSPDKDEEVVPHPEPFVANSTRLPFAQHSEKGNLMALRQRIIPDIELENLRCKKCDTRCPHIQDLYDHVAKHYNWMRYACKLCNFKHYYFDKLPEHVKVVHKLKGDKDFYFSTVKAIDGPEALELATPVEEPSEPEETSPDSRRPSRCSSDSSRLSDESTSSCTRVEGSRKRKTTHKLPSKGIAKRRKSFRGKEQDSDWENNADSLGNIKAFEENSSDLDDTYDKVGKKTVELNTSVASRRPVRKKAKPKNEDFEYDLSNLLKMEAQGYRDSQTVATTTKPIQPRNKKPQHDSISNYEMLNKECCGALCTLSRKALADATAHMKTFIHVSPKEKSSTIFVRPMLPRGLSRTDKLSPKKDNTEEKKDSPSKDISKENVTMDVEKVTTDIKTCHTNKDATSSKSSDPVNTCNTHSTKDKDPSDLNTSIISAPEKINTTSTKAQEQNVLNKNQCDIIKPKSISIPSVVPLKFRRQSLDVMKNPIINKNISDFSRAGMKTKILVIKPINRNKDGTNTVNTPLKFQTIKLKETNKMSPREDKTSDQVVVVKVPKVERISRPLPDTAKACEKSLAINVNDDPLVSNEETKCSGNLKVDEILSLEKNGDVNSEPGTIGIEPVKTLNKPKTINPDGEKESNLLGIQSVTEINETKLNNIDSAPTAVDESKKIIINEITSEKSTINVVKATSETLVDNLPEMVCN